MANCPLDDAASPDVFWGTNQFSQLDDISKPQPWK